MPKPDDLRLQMLGNDNPLRKAGNAVKGRGNSIRVDNELEKADPGPAAPTAAPAGGMTQAAFSRSAPSKVDGVTRAKKLADMLRKRDAELNP